MFSDEFGSSLTTIRDGSLIIDAEGRIGGTLTTEDGTPFPSAANFSGLMATDKKLVAGGVRTIDGNNLRDVESGLVLLQKEPAPATTFATGDLGGAWTFNQLIFDPSTAATTTWVRGTLNVSPVGQVTSGTLVAFTASAGTAVPGQDHPDRPGRRRRHHPDRQLAGDQRRDVGGLQSHIGQRDLHSQRDDQELHDRDRRL